jgi:hypothetical protein
MHIVRSLGLHRNRKFLHQLNKMFKEDCAMDLVALKTRRWIIKLALI